MAGFSREKTRSRGLRQQVTREQRKRTYVFFICMFSALAYLAYNLIFGEAGLLKYMELKRNRQRIESEISRINKENKALGEQVNSLKKDPYYIEKYAREEYGLAKPDEFIFQFKKKDR